MTSKPSMFVIEKQISEVDETSIIKSLFIFI
jgi:hypothetical protein